MAAYLSTLVELAGTRQPVLQFNRVDFRLPWLRARFPEAVLIHLYRDPREEWLSAVQDLPREQWDDPHAADAYESLLWACSLAPELPCLLGPTVTHPYQRHYLLWRLSYLMGRRCADLSVSFERELQDRPRHTVSQLLDLVRPGSSRRVDEIAALVKRRRATRADRYRSAEWFASVERACDEQLRSLGLDQRFALSPLSDIRAGAADVWERYTTTARDEAGRLLVRMVAALRGPAIDLSRTLRDVGWNASNVVVENERLVLENTRLRQASPGRHPASGYSTPPGPGSPPGP